MLKIFMNEPFATSHELAQAKRLVQLLDGYAVHRQVWLCLNFNLGGKAIDGAVITKDGFVIVELKAVGGDVSCGSSVENSQWTWRADPMGSVQMIKTAPYANPFSQVKNYRTAAIGEFEQQQNGFLGKISLMQDPKNFAWWVKGCVLVSMRDAADVKVATGPLSFGTEKWFGCGTLGKVADIVDGLAHGVSLSEKEVERLIANVLGLNRVDSVIEWFEPEVDSEVQPGEPRIATIAEPVETALDAFMKRYGKGSTAKPPKMAKPVARVSGTATHVINDFAEIESLFSASETSPVVSSSEDRNVVAAAPSDCAFLKMTLQGEMESLAPEYGQLSEFSGPAAVDLVLRDFPQLSNFGVSKVLRFGDSVSDADGERLLLYFEEKYGASPQWMGLTYVRGGVEFVFGKSIVAPAPSEEDRQKEVPYERPIGTRFLMARWTRELIEREVEGLPLLSAQEVQQTTELSADDVRRYAKTYFPRSCAEAFVVVDWLMGFGTTPSKVTVLDVGCGCGGASLGCLLALHKHGAGDKSEIAITGVDVNNHALGFAKNLFDNARPQFREHKLSFETKNGDMRTLLSEGPLYDVVIASKSIGELALTQGADVYMQSVRSCAGRVDAHGMLILIDLPKHRASMEKAVDALTDAGFEGWFKSLSIALDGTSDGEEYVCACLSRGASKKINKE